MNETFSRRSVIWLIAIGGLAFGVAGYFALDGAGHRATLTASELVYSKSAIGHQAFGDVLRRAGIPVRGSRSGSSSGAAGSDLLVILEPQPGHFRPERIRSLLSARTVLLVLPKWSGTPSPARPGWIDAAALHPLEEIQALLRVRVPGARVLRPTPAPRWNLPPGRPAPTLARPQLLRSLLMLPIVSSDQGILVGEVPRSGGRIWVVSDPDLLSNHGIGNGDNAFLAFSLVRELLPAGGTVVVDETIHHATGLVRWKPPSFLRALLEPPFLVVTLQIAAALLILLLASGRRFGSPLPALRARPRGSPALLDNMARLLESGDHGPEIVRRYHELVRQDVLRRLHAPPGADDDALAEWLDRTGERRGLEVSYTRLRDAAAAAGAPGRRSRATLVAVGRDLFRWRGEMTDGR